MEDNYIPRLIDGQVQEYLNNFGAVAIEGCKWCGKSTTAKQFAASSIELQNTEENQNVLQLAANQPSLILQGDKPRLIDEWQDAPEIWDAIRYDVDSTGLVGQYILTGSSVPRKKRPKHSGAGRIAKITMRPMSLYESHESDGSISLKNLFDGNIHIKGTSDLKLPDIAYLCVRGGWPSAIVRKPTNPSLLAREYLNAIIDRSDGFENAEYYSPGRMRALLRGLARGISTPIKLTTLISDIASNTGTTISDVTAANYIATLEQTHLLDDIEAWSPNLRSKTQIRSAKKRNFSDPSLAANALYASQEDLITDFNSFGLIFESLALRDLNIYAQSLGGNLYYYRDANGLESDAIIHLNNGRWCAIEIKLGADEETLDEAAKSLLRFQDAVDTDSMKEPSFLMILSGISKYAYRRKDGVLVIPIGCLKP